MENKDIEIELRFPLKNPKDVINFLNTNAKPISKDLFQKDTYFTPIHRDFLNVKYPYEWLRLRETNKENSLNYKHFYPENVEKTDYCDEFEIKIDNIELMKKILLNLNFKKIVVVEKSRSTWMFKDVEIAVDEVKDLGSYIELEAKNHFEDPKKGKEYLYSILEELNAEVGEEELRGYPFMVIEKQKF